MSRGDEKPLDDTLAAPSAGETPTPPLDTDGAARATAATGPGTRIAGRYQLMALVGVGGMGSVYRAIDLELGEPVAVKVLRRELVDAPGALERFRDEVRLARRVTHVNVARVFDIGEHEGEKFLTMEFVEGGALSSAIAGGPLPLDEAMRVAREMCAGVAAAHAAGVVHRDLKPDNVLLARDGRVVVTDFGIARASEGANRPNLTTGIVGTPAYMAPEQVEARPDIDARADVYALGATIYELFTGARAWPGDAPLAVAAVRLVHPPPDPRRARPSLPEALATLVVRCMAQQRDERPADAGQVLAELSAIAAPTAPPTVAPPRVGAAMPEDRGVSLAVLPLQNAGPPEHQAIVDAITDEIVDTLSMTRGLRVRARGAVTKYRAMDRDPREIGEELGVQVVAEGSLRRQSGRLRLSMRLTNAGDGFQVWAKRFDVEEAEALHLSESVAEAMAEALTARMTGRRREAPAAADGVAVDLYLRGRAEVRRFGPQATAAGLALLEQAVERAPSDPRIVAGYAIAKARAWYFAGGPGDEVDAAVARAMAISGETGEAWLASALAGFYAGDMGRAARDARIAVARAPGLIEAHFLIARILVEAGRCEDGVRRLEALRTIDPDFLPVQVELWRARELSGEHERADAALSKLPPAAEQRVLLDRARGALWRRDLPAAERLLRSTPAMGTSLMTLGRAMLQAMVEGVQDRDALDRFERSSERGPPRKIAWMRQLFAEVAAALGAREDVLRNIEASAAATLSDLLWLDRCPALDAFRLEPRFVVARAAVERTIAPALAAYDAVSTGSSS